LQKQTLSSFLNDCCYKAATIIVTKARTLIFVDTPEPDTMVSKLNDGLIGQVAKGLMSVTEHDIAAWRLGDTGEFRDDGMLTENLYNNITQASNIVHVPDVFITREKRFVPDENNIMRLEPDVHEINFTKAWIGGFTMYALNNPITASVFIEGRDILISAAMLSVAEIVIMMKTELRKLVASL
jgi:hypothetical protein